MRHSWKTTWGRPRRWQLLATTAAVGLATVGSSPFFQTPQAEAAGPHEFVVTVNVDDTTRPVIPADFLGLSIEWGSKPGYFGVNSAASAPVAGQPLAPFVQILKNLGTGNVRVGGWSSDGYHYKANASSDFTHSFSGNYGPDAVKSILQTSATAGWNTTLGCSSVGDSVDAALECANMLKYAHDSSGYWANLQAFEVGNERNANGPTAPALSFANYQKLFYDFGHQTSLAGWGATKMVGPATSGCQPTNPSGQTGWCNDMSALATDSPYGVGTPRIANYSFHYYAVGSGSWTMNQLLAQSTMDGAKQPIANTLAGANGTDVRMQEGNSGTMGSTGPKDAHGTALWGLDYLFTAATSGLSGVNFHNCDGPDTTPGGPCQYNPYVATATGGSPAYTVQAKPLYYAMYLFKYAADNQILTTSCSDNVCSSADNVKVYATRDQGATPNRYRVWVINKGGSTQTVNIHPTRPTGPAFTFGVKQTSNDPNATSGTTVGDGTFGTNGVLTGWHQDSIALNSVGNYVISVPPYSASIVSASY